jgi:hypothetical protein
VNSSTIDKEDNRRIRVSKMQKANYNYYHPKLRGMKEGIRSLIAI